MSIRIICLSESFLDSSILTENNNLRINGYKMVRAHHSCKVKKGGVCVLMLGNHCQFIFSDCLTLEVTISNKKG